MRRAVLLGGLTVGLALAIGAASCQQGEDTVPLTITMPGLTSGNQDAGPPGAGNQEAGPPGAGNEDVGRVRFPAIDTTIYSRQQDGIRRQFSVGDVPKAGDRYELVIETFMGASDNTKTLTLHFSPEAVCAPPDEDKGELIRIACAATSPADGVQKPFGVVCSGVYKYEGEPPDTCEGTYACIKCAGGVRICSENPECVG